MLGRSIRKRCAEAIDPLGETMKSEVSQSSSQRWRQSRTEDLNGPVGRIVRKPTVVQIYVAQDPSAPILRGQSRVHSKGGDALGVRLTWVLGAMLFNCQAIRRSIRNPDGYPRSDREQTLSEDGIYDHCNGVRFSHRVVSRAAA